MASQEMSFDTFMSVRKAATEAYVRGDGGPLDEIVTRDMPATFFGPQGGEITGAAAVAKTYAEGARTFEPDGTTRLEVLQAHASGDLAFWSGVQHAKAHFVGEKGPIDMELRITEVFRREKGEWKLVHRHADTLTEARPPQDA